MMDMTAQASSRVETMDPTLGPGSGPLRWAEGVLRDQGMPREELGVVLSSEDAEIVRRHLELHLERLEESFLGQRRLAASALRILTETASVPR